VDTIGCLVVVVVRAANVYDGRATREALMALFSVVDTIKKIWADSACKGEEFIRWVKEKFDRILEVVEKKKTGQGFQVLPRRWVVERTFAWLVRSRRLSKDYERKTTLSEGQVYIASSRLMLRRICNDFNYSKRFE
jgi:putative transposase